MSNGTLAPPKDPSSPGALPHLPPPPPPPKPSKPAPSELPPAAAPLLALPPRLSPEDAEKLATIWAAEARHAAASEEERRATWTPLRDATLAASPPVSSPSGSGKLVVDPAVVSRLVCGRASEAELGELSRSTLSSLWFFLSSTFVDTTAEWNYLTEFAWPDLQRRAQRLGLTFDVVDLR